MFQQKYGIKPERFLFWLGIFLATIIVAYYKLFNDAPIAFWAILIMENVISIGIGLENLMEEAMNEVESGPILWLVTGGTILGSIMVLAMFFIDFKLALVLLVSETVAFGISKIKNNQTHL